MFDDKKIYGEHESKLDDEPVTDEEENHFVNVEGGGSQEKTGRLEFESALMQLQFNCKGVAPCPKRTLNMGPK
jgi:hypothetical protein